MSRTLLFSVLLFAVVLLGCRDDRQRQMSPELYVTSAVDTLMAYSIYSTRLNADDLKSKALSRSSRATTTEETYRAIEHIIRESGDHHGFLIWPAPENPGTARLGELPEGRGVRYYYSTAFNYISVPGFWGSEGAGAFANAIQSAIHDMSDNQACGWIIDLRENWGGNMWPMIAGLGPVLGEGTLGYFEYPSGDRSAWAYRAGASLLNGEIRLQADDPALPISQYGPIAVLIGENTSSSGEAVVVAFKGLPNVRLFGAPTNGMTTAIETKELSDGARLGISTSWFVDRTGKIHEGQIIPDEFVDYDTIRDGAYDAGVMTALDWFESIGCDIQEKEEA
jgi:carboxyl-terminal processing protease